MEALAVICPLDISMQDREWIEDLRQQHDPQHALVEAHFTLMFPLTGVSLSTLVKHVGTVADQTPPIKFQLVRALAVPDVFAPQSHVFLIPEEGDADVRRLHSALYGGELGVKREADIPFQPHVTVAVFEAQSTAELLARELGEVYIEGELRTMILLSLDGDAITREAAFSLL